MVGFPAMVFLLFSRRLMVVTLKLLRLTAAAGVMAYEIGPWAPPGSASDSGKVCV